MKYKVTVEIVIDEEDLEEFAEENACRIPDVDDVIYGDLQSTSYCYDFRIVDTVKG